MAGQEVTELAGLVEVLPKVNYFALVVGPPGAGKSSLAAMLAHERLAEGRWVFVQDQNREFHAVGATEYTSPELALRAIAAAFEEQRPVSRFFALATPRGADDVLDLAVKLGERWNQRHQSVRVPLTLIINESSSFEGSGPTWIDKVQERAINLRRHLGLELVYCLQRPSQLPSSVWEVCTDVFLFAQQRADRIDMLEKNLNLPRGQLAGLAHLERFRYLHWQAGRGLV